MNINVSLCNCKTDDVAIVVDQVRASTTITVALNYFNKVIPLNDSQKALKIKEEDDDVILVSGGATRSDSVYNGLQKVSYEYVMIHDGARPYVSSKILDDTKQCLSKHNACVAMVDCKDTIKKVIDNKVVKTYDRTTLKNAQTPQSFKTSLIIEAYQKAIADNFIATDDASIYEVYGKDDVYVIEGSYDNIKITTIEDIK